MEQDNLSESKPSYRKLDENENRDTYEKNKYILPMIIGGVILLAVILYFALNSQSHYDNGVQYLKQDKYTEALVEFKKVDPDNKDFTMSQSKINYINGLLAYKEGAYPQAKVYLTKVEPGDEYYRESRLMIEKIDMASKQGNLDLLSEKINQNTSGKDTVIIKETVIEKPVEKVGEAETPKEDQQSVRKYKSDLVSLSGKFEAMYQSARNSSIESKKTFVRDMDSLYFEFKKLQPAGQSDKVVELKDAAGSWMQKRLEYINRLISENSVQETKSTIVLKEQGDKDYLLLQTMIKNNQF